MVDHEHITGDQVYGLQKRTLAPIIMKSIAELSKKPALAQWSVPVEQQKEFHKNTAISNRHAPAPEHLQGDLDQIFVTGMRVIEYCNGHDQPLMMHVANQLGQTLSVGGKANFLMGPTKGMTVVVNEDIHEPADKMTRNMLKIWEACDPSVLKREFSSVGQGVDAVPCISVDGAAAGLLEEKPHLFNNYQLDLSQMVPNTRFCVVDKTIGTRLFQYMEKTIGDIKNNFTSAKDFVVSFEPVTGKWDNDELLVGDQAGLASDKKVLHTARVKKQPALIFAKIEVQYGTISNMFPENDTKKK